MAVVERLCEPSSLFLELVETSRWRVLPGMHKYVAVVWTIPSCRGPLLWKVR